MNLRHLIRLAHSPLRNYVLPGVTSYLIGERAPNGSLMRLFHSDRIQVMAVTPHSHRYDFEALVLQGSVQNRIWRIEGDGDPYCLVTIEYLGKPGNYNKTIGQISQWRFVDEVYEAKANYGMSHHQIHSIYFGRDTWVLVVEGPTISSSSFMLEPVVDGVVIQTSKTEDWMFQAG